MWCGTEALGDLSGKLPKTTSITNEPRVSRARGVPIDGDAGFGLTLSLAAAHTPAVHERPPDDPVDPARQGPAVGVSDASGATAGCGGGRRHRIRARTRREPGVWRDRRRGWSDDGVNRSHGTFSFGYAAIRTPSNPRERARRGPVPLDRDRAGFEVAAAAGYSPCARRVFSSAVRVGRR